MSAEASTAERSGAPEASSEERRVIIRTVNMKKHYVVKGVVTEALRGVDAEIYMGEFISVMGPSG